MSLSTCGLDVTSSQGFPRGFPKLVRALYGILTLKRANTVEERG